MEPKIFADGLIFKLPRENAPSYVKGSLYINVEKFIEFLHAHNTNSGGINIDIKESTKGNIYCELNTWKPEKPESLKEPEQKDEIEYPAEDINPDDIPF
jgi:hypothetical protein